ncbi:hypothetical protein WH91_04850 [Devosia psychrophila]|uniref:Transposase n=1 Tax=Devosia psychrophila TaxID=728005 RepID=A0ABR5E1A0_9HYPH|nr:hypothetical protein WH91_04850 [Devosia psychrophila]
MRKQKGRDGIYPFVRFRREHKAPLEEQTVTKSGNMEIPDNATLRTARIVSALTGMYVTKSIFEALPMACEARLHRHARNVVQRGQ